MNWQTERAPHIPDLKWAHFIGTVIKNISISLKVYDMKKILKNIKKEGNIFIANNTPKSMLAYRKFVWLIGGVAVVIVLVLAIIYGRGFFVNTKLLELSLLPSVPQSSPMNTFGDGSPIVTGINAAVKTDIVSTQSIVSPNLNQNNQAGMVTFGIGSPIVSGAGAHADVKVQIKGKE